MKRDGQMDDREAQNGRRSKVTATETASRMNSVYKINWPLWHQNSVTKQSMPI